MKKKQSSQNFHDKKKYLGVATGHNEDFTLTFITFCLLFRYFAFFLGALNKCEKLKTKKNSDSLLIRVILVVFR